MQTGNTIISVILGANVKSVHVRITAILIAIAIYPALWGCDGDSSTGSIQAPEFDFDGELIAFRSDRDGRNDIWLMNPDGSQLINLTKSPDNDTDPAWSPDGSRIAFVSTRSGNADLWIMNADGSGLIQVTDNQGSVRFPSWSPDGNLIAYSANVDGQRDIYIISAPGSAAVSQIDGRVKITFVGETNGKLDIWVMEPDGSNKKNVTQSEADEFYSSWMSGESSARAVNGSPAIASRIIFDSYRNGRWDIYSIREDGTDLVRLTNHPAEDRMPRWRPRP
jgi:TolB protein